MRVWRRRAGAAVLTLAFLAEASFFTGGFFSLSVSASFVVKAEASTAAAPQRRRRRRRGQRRPAADRIREIQQALIRESYLEGKPTGKWDKVTRQAMSRFQEANNLPVTGKINARSLIKLGLGSKTAGVGAPLSKSGAATGGQRSAGTEDPDGGPDS